MLSRYERFATSIAAIYHHIQHIEREEMVRLGLKGTYAQYLAALRRHPEGMTSAQLCETCDRDKAAVSRAVGEMERAGLIVRESVSVDSLYRARLLLNEEGKRAADFVSERAQTAVNAVGGGLSESDRQVLYAALESIAANLETVVRDGLNK